MLVLPIKHRSITVRDDAYRRLEALRETQFGRVSFSDVIDTLLNRVRK